MKALVRSVVSTGLLPNLARLRDGEGGAGVELVTTSGEGKERQLQFNARSCNRDIVSRVL